MSTIDASPENILPIEITAEQRTDLSLRRDVLRGALAGGAAALVASAVMLWLGRRGDGVFLTQFLSDRMTALVPLNLFERVLGSLESSAKPFALVGLTLVQTAVGALLGIGYALVQRQRPMRRLAGAALLSLAVWLLLCIVAAPLGRVGLFAHDAPGGAGATLRAFAAAAVIVGVIVALLVPAPVVEAEDTDPQRRRLLVMAGVGITTLIAFWYTGDYVRTLRKKDSAKPVAVTNTNGSTAPAPGTPSTPLPPLGSTFEFEGMPKPITPTEEFYVVSKNFVDPSVSASEWNLEVTGLVNNPFTMTLTDLTNHESTEFTSTLECISNSVGGEYISNGVWRGFPLLDLLNQAGLQDGVVDIELHAADGYIESIPVEKAIEPDVMLVHTLNGDPLPDAHGFPARLIVPNIFGMKNVKWLAKVIAVNNDVQGYWQERGWSDVATVQTMSRIDAPHSSEKIALGQPFMLGGVAFAGSRGISKVEVSFDGSKTWSDATLADEIAPLAWRLWEAQYTPTKTGSLSIAVRATDGTGETQTDQRNDPAPDGATGYHSIRVTIR